MQGFFCFINLPFIFRFRKNEYGQIIINSMKKIAVFCGSSGGVNGIYIDYARYTGELLASRGIEIIYGGAKIGIMGAVADSALSRGGRVTGIIPEFLKTREIAHDGLTRLITVQSMHERKAMAYEMSDGAIVMPGGYGTLDETFEMITWGQLGLHPKPVGLLNINGYYDDLISMVRKMHQEGFINRSSKDMLLQGGEIESLLEDMLDYIPPPTPKWFMDN